MTSDFSDRSLDDLYSDLQRNTWAGGNILRGEVPRLFVVTALPSASIERRHQVLILAGDTGEADTPYICIKNASNTYEWLEVGSGNEAASSTSDLKDAMVSNGIVTDGGATPLDLDGGAATVGNFTHEGTQIGFFGTSGETKRTLTGSRSSQTVAVLALLADILDDYGLLTDSTTA